MCEQRSKNNVQRFYLSSITISCAFAFFVLHELPDPSRFFSEMGQALKSNGRLLVAEPKGHVSESDLEESIALAEKANFTVKDRPRIPRSHSVLLEQNGRNA